MSEVSGLADARDHSLLDAALTGAGFLFFLAVATGWLQAGVALLVEVLR